LMAMTWLESGWQNDVVSSAGAIGIGQLMPDTVTWLEDIVIREPLDPHDPDDNIRMSARYLRWLLDRTGGDAATALAGYYQGLGAVRSSGVFPSTRVYVADVLFFRDRHF
ncbi:MAG: lytic transglycosylase domain-containing protein, partial [Actinomycetota bacterium]|nr:lytic transglycosylase domain-containing protein [Actinomycetota bacterium]